MHNFTEELCAFTNLPQPLPQSYFLSLPSALSDPPTSLTYSYSGCTRPQASRKFYAISLFFFFAPTVSPIAFAFICRTFGYFSRFTSRSMPFEFFLLNLTPFLSQSFFGVCLLNALFIEYV